MPRIIDSVETEFDTDFAMFNAWQPGVEMYAGVASFAISVPGFVRMECGDKYARVRARAERWDARPPLIDGWEDCDELPFEEVAGAGRLMLGGFDDGTVGLDVSGLGRGRIEVFARGRRAFEHGEQLDLSSLPHEEWLLRLYPANGPADPMAGGPRRVAGGSLLETSPWLAAVRGFRTTGWHHILANSPGFSLASTALVEARAPISRQELATRMAQRMRPPVSDSDDAEAFPLPPRNPLADSKDPLVYLTGRTAVVTIGNAIDAMLQIGLLIVETRFGQVLLIPNPSPMNAWQLTAIPEVTRAWARKDALYSEHAYIASDIAHAVHWMQPSGLTATPREMAVRWHTSVSDVLGAIRLLGGTHRVTSDRKLAFDSDLAVDEPVTLMQGPRWVAE